MTDALPPQMPDLADAATCIWVDDADAAAMSAFAAACLAVLDDCVDQPFGSGTTSLDPNGRPRPSTFGTRHDAPDGRRVEIRRGRAREADDRIDEYAVALTRPGAPPVALELRIRAVEDPARPGRDQTRALALRIAALADRLSTGLRGLRAPALDDCVRRTAAIAGLLAHRAGLAGTAKLLVEWDPVDGTSIQLLGLGRGASLDEASTTLLLTCQPHLQLHLRTGSTGKTWFQTRDKVVERIPASPPDAVATIRALADLGLSALPSVRPAMRD